MENQKQLSPEENLNNVVAAMLKWKQDCGAEISLSAQMQAVLIQSEAKVKELKGQVESLNKKIDEMTEKAKDKKKDK